MIPTFLARFFGIGVYKSANVQYAFALTFDDGPDPVYTPMVLDLLKEYEVKAAFFVLGRKAEQHSELIRRIHREGHLIGIHQFTHTANWLLAPFQIRHRINRTATVIEEITGQRPVYYRPPWGLLTLTDLFQKRYPIVLWSLMVGDWAGENRQKSVKDKLMTGLRHGSIIVLHDSGATAGAKKDAPLYMMASLKAFLQGVQRGKYHCGRIDDLLCLSESKHTVTQKMFSRK
jgi:peptidoglycan/xylan/chitin deacetylase (PgdA/CDA1 family)